MLSKKKIHIMPDGQCLIKIRPGIFITEDIIKIKLYETPEKIWGTQKWKGATPIFKNKLNKNKKATSKETITENKKVNALVAWIRKYFIAASLLEGDLIKKGIKIINRPSIVNHIIIQECVLKAINIKHKPVEIDRTTWIVERGFLRQGMNLLA